MSDALANFHVAMPEPYVSRLCGRPTKPGTPCRRQRMGASGLFTPMRFYGGSCALHVTADEEALYAAGAQAVMADDHRRFLALHRSFPVACWDWPVTAGGEGRAAEARACSDPDKARRLAWDLLADWQARRCAICGGPSRVLDHSHETGLVRGWLCRRCNISEGFDGPAGDQFSRYRQKNPASILGITIRYYSPFTGWAEAADELQPPSDRSPGYLLAAYLEEENGDDISPAGRRRDHPTNGAGL